MNGGAGQQGEARTGRMPVRRLVPGRKRGLTRVERQDLRNALLFISPWIVGFGLFLGFPICASIYYSLSDFSVLEAPRFVGLTNYSQLLTDDVFHQALSNTFFYAAGAIPLGIVLAFSLALLLNTGVRGMAVYRTIYFLPSLVPSIAMAILWMWILNGKSGILNYVLRTLGSNLGWCALAAATVLLGLRYAHGATRLPRRHDPIGAASGALALAGLVTLVATMVTARTALLGGYAGDPPSWLSSTLWVKPALIIMSLWSTGHAVVIYLAGLQDVPVHLYEAADLDGANWWQKIRTVTIPMMSPVILFNGVMAIIGTFNYFAIPFVMSPGGQPARSAYFVAVNLYDNAFEYLRMGYASAMAWVLFVMVFVLTMVAMKMSQKHVHYADS